MNTKYNMRIRDIIRIEEQQNLVAASSESNKYLSQLTFQEDLKITAMHSMDGESVPFSETLYPTGNVEDWLLEVERVMRQSILESVKLSVEDYPRVRDRLSLLCLNDLIDLINCLTIELSTCPIYLVR